MVAARRLRSMPSLRQSLARTLRATQPQRYVSARPVEISLTIL